MNPDQNIFVTRQMLKDDARSALSRQSVLLKLIFCGFFFIAVLIMFEFFSSYMFSALFYSVTDEIQIQNYSMIFSAAIKIPQLILLFPLFMGVFRVSAKLSNGSNADVIEMFSYYGSYKNLKTAWTVGAILYLPLILLTAIKSILPFLSNDEAFVKATLPLIKLGINTIYFFTAVFVLGRLLPFINSVVCGGDQPISLCLKASLKSTKGKMWKLFAFHLSFIPWILLSILTVGVLFVIFTFPYMLIAECLYSKYLLTGKYRDHITEDTL